MNLKKNNILDSWDFLELTNYLIAVIFLVNLIAKHFFYHSLPYANTLVIASTVYFAIQHIYIVIATEAELKYLKRISLDLIAIAVIIVFNDYLIIFQLYLIVRQFILLLDKFFSTKPAKSFLIKFRHHPAKVILSSFALLILLGTTFLALPISSADGNSIGILDALFTSTSATCVTGLIVLDTGSAFSFFGKFVIMLLIQIGGLGIMTFSTALIMLLGKKISIGGKSLIKGVLDDNIQKDLNNLLEGIIITTILFEIAGAILLYIRLSPNLPSVKTAIWHSVFHSISSFCNAGFCFYSDSFSAYRSDIIINMTVMMLIIFGGIGFSVLMDMKYNFFQKRRPFRFLSLHSKIVIATTLILIFGGTFIIFILDYSNQLMGMSISEGFLASLFQSVTTRTAGFNTIDISQINYATALFMIVLMFIGASPGSTGGGIKTTTFAVMVLSIISIIKGRDDVEVYKRKLSEKITKEVVALVAISVAILVTLILVLSLSEKGTSFIKIAFEAVSAFGTVGLSMGITSNLTSIGKIAIILLMYLGRVGPLTLAFALGEKKLKSAYHYPEGNIGIG